jgi:lysophospholipase L1-like esterase
MVRLRYIFMIMLVVVTSCRQIEPLVEQELSQGPEFTAEIESFDPETKTALDGNSVVWSAADQIAVFQGMAKADKYQVNDDCVGTTSGTFGIVAKGEAAAEETFNANIAIYPYQDGLAVTPTSATEYKITGLTIPSTQTYTANTFSSGSFLMAAITDDLDGHTLSFRNLCGALKLQLKGTAKVKTIELKGNDSEPLSGDAIVKVYPDGSAPEITMSQDTSPIVTLDCGDGVQLDETTATDFIITVPPTTFENGFTATVTCTDGGVAKIETAKPNPIQRSYIHTMPEITVEAEYEIKILAIGNSFSTDALQYLYGILKDAGYDYVKIGNLNIGGCNLKTHANHISTNNPEYTYYTNSTGTWTSTESYHPHDAFDSEDWDYITMQQVSHLSGMMNTYDDYLQTIVSVVKEHCPDAELVWHMTWAYDQTATHSGFSNYNNDQQTMYNAILEVVKTRILTDDNFSKVIPNATTIQNLRSSYLEDRLTRDGYHLSTDIGRYAAALTYAKALTGCDLTDITYTPSNSCTSSELRAIKDAVNKAVATPYEVTPSAYPQEDNVREDFASARWIKNRYINADTGGFAIGYTEGRCTVCEDYIPVKGGMTYNMTLDGEAKAIRWYAWYDSDKKYISGNGSEATDLVAPDNACYIRVTIYSDSGWYPINTQEIDENGYLTSPAASRIKLIPVTRFNGNKLWVFGDSITAGVGTTSPYYFSQILCDNMGFASLKRSGHSGNEFSHGIDDYGYTILDKMESALVSAPGNCDVLIICFGVNDWTWGRNIEGDRAIGSKTDETKYTICGAVNLFCQKLKTIFADYPDVEIYFATPTPTKNSPISGGNPGGKSWDQSKQNYNGNTLRDICDAIAERVSSYGYGVLDLNRYFAENINASTNLDDIFPDGLHPNEEGNKLIASVLEDLLLNPSEIESEPEIASSYGLITQLSAGM